MAICFEDQENDQISKPPQEQCANAYAVRGHYFCLWVVGAWSCLLIQQGKPTLSCVYTQTVAYKNTRDMKRALFLVLLSTMWIAAFSQKIVKNEKDAFTGNQVTETSYATLSDGLTCAIRAVNGKAVLLVSFNGGDEVYTMERDAQFMFKLQNDSIITLTNIEDAVSEYKSFTIGSTRISHFLLQTKYILPEEQLALLKSDKITKVRFNTTAGYIERNVSEKNAKKLLKLFSLI